MASIHDPLRMKISKTMFDELVMVEPKPDTIKIISHNLEWVEIEGSHLEIGRWFRDAYIQIH